MPTIQTLDDTNNFDTIFCPPVNSSGDAYHIVAYLILCRDLSKKEVPHLVLFYDTKDTKTQAKRTKALLRSFGFYNVTVAEFLNAMNRSHFAKSRMENSINEILGYSENAVDQKITTSLLSYAYLLHGSSIFDVIRSYVMDLSFRPRIEPAYQWADDQLKSINKALKISKNPFVVLHLRQSKGSNKEQNFSRSVLRIIAKLLASRGIKLVIMDVGGTQGSRFAKDHKDKEYGNIFRLNAFEDVEDLSEKYTKLPHIFLLSIFASHPKCLGVVGNTSGTLDMAAFVGNKVLCVHKFANVSKRKLIIGYQDMRIMLQSTMMSVYDVDLNKLAEVLSLWLDSKTHNLYYDDHKRPLEASKFRSSHFDRKCFVFDVEQKIANPGFTAQYLQVSYNHKISGIMKHILKESIKLKEAAPVEAIVKQEQKDDSNLKTAKVRNRARSLPF